MSVVRLSIVEFAYPHQTRMLADVSLDISAGWTAIVGPNGAGKSTLVRLICGDLQARQGSIVSPFSCRTSQEPDFQIVAEFTQEWGKNAAFWKSLFGLDFVDLNSWSSLSPGWKHRWMLGAVFWRNPPLLVLDEPTNHLDLEGRDLLIRAMSRYDGVGLVVSHDRAFLNQTTTETIWVENGRVEHFKCGLEPAVDRVRAQKRSQLDSLNDAQAQLKTAQMQVHQVAATHDASKRSLSVKSRMKNAGDRDAGTDARKIRAQRAEASHGRARRVSKGDLERTQKHVESLVRPNAEGRELKIEATPRAGEWVFRFEGEVRAGECRLLSAIWNVERQARVWLQGGNGAGKTSLMNTVLRSLTIPVLFVPQVISHAEVVGFWQGLPSDLRRQVMHVAAALLLDVKAVLDDVHMSPGEVRKLAFAIGLVNQPELVVLDEPTNDLDMPSIERLERVLNTYAGALIIVSHDVAFVEALGLEAISLEDLIGSSSP